MVASSSRTSKRTRGESAARFATRWCRQGERSMLTKKTLLIVLCSLVFPTAPLLHAQATGSFAGTVSDKTGSVISGATVKATAPATGVSRESKTDGSGHYLMTLLPIGDYTIRVEFQGFQTAEEKDVQIGR